MKLADRVRLTFFTSKRFLPSAPPSAAPALDLLASFFDGAVEPEGASVMSTSAMVIDFVLCLYGRFKDEGTSVGGVDGAGGSLYL